jgi:hypothetical protein
VSNSESTGAFASDHQRSIGDQNTGAITNVLPQTHSNFARLHQTICVMLEKIVRMSRTSWVLEIS